MNTSNGLLRPEIELDWLELMINVDMNIHKQLYELRARSETGYRLNIATEGRLGQLSGKIITRFEGGFATTLLDGSSISQ